MNVDRQQVVDALEQALLERASKLADEYVARAERARRHLLDEAQEKLHLREQQATMRAQAEAERYYRRQVQASELELVRRLDRLRWTLVQDVLEGVRNGLRAYTEKPEYETTFTALLHQAAGAIEREELVAEANQADIERFGARWETLAAGVEGKRIRLAPHPIDCSGGVRVRDPDDRIRVDNTFEGRLDRLQEGLLQVVTERLFAAEISRRGLLGD